MNRKRKQEIIKSMKSFSKEKYSRKEMLSELFTLQDETVRLTFNDEHSNLADLKIWDVEKHLKCLNKECGNVADEEIARFRTGSKKLCNMIKSYISGIRGETKAFRSLENIHSKNIVLKNVELNDGLRRTEVDALVITPKAVTIVEVKNTSRNIFIDEEGNFYRTGDFLQWDCNIAKKMIIKEDLIRKTLDDCGFKDIVIKKILVFTDNRIVVHNKYSSINTCFAGQLSHIIDSYRDGINLEDDQMEHIKMLFKEAECKEAYPLEFDVDQFKEEFATVMVILEEAHSKAEEPERRHFMKNNKIFKKATKIITSKEVRIFGRKVAIAAFSIGSTVVINLLKKGGSLR